MPKSKDEKKKEKEKKKRNKGKSKKENEKEKLRVHKIIVVIGVIEIAKIILSLNHVNKSWKYFMCLDITPTNDILRITMNFVISKSYIIF